MRKNPGHSPGGTIFRITEDILTEQRWGCASSNCGKEGRSQLDQGVENTLGNLRNPRGDIGAPAAVPAHPSTKLIPIPFPSQTQGIQGIPSSPLVPVVIGHKPGQSPGQVFRAGAVQGQSGHLRGERGRALALGVSSSAHLGTWAGCGRGDDACQLLGLRTCREHPQGHQSGHRTSWASTARCWATLASPL